MVSNRLLEAQMSNGVTTAAHVDAAPKIRRDVKIDFKLDQSKIFKLSGNNVTTTAGRSR